jgi:undecaprenyl-diphosphatase
MPLYQIILLALIQGVTEFLPISSSAHLILPSQVLGWKDQGLAFDLAVHLGTLIAVLVYLRKDIFSMILACVRVLSEKKLNPDAKLSLWVVLATLPAVVIGFFVKDYVELYLRSVLVIALASILFGILLAVVDRKAHKSQKVVKSLGAMNLNNSLFIGFAQALAFIPGTSRSGITITAALALGFSRKESLRFSFLLSIPLILAGALLSALDLIEAETSLNIWQDIALATLISGLSAFACVHLFMTWVEKLGMMPFVIYRVLLGFVLIALYVSL